MERDRENTGNVFGPQPVEYAGTKPREFKLSLIKTAYKQAVSNKAKSNKVALTASEK